MCYLRDNIRNKGCNLWNPYLITVLLTISFDKLPCNWLRTLQLWGFSEHGPQLPQSCQIGWRNSDWSQRFETGSYLGFFGGGTEKKVHQWAFGQRKSYHMPGTWKAPSCSTIDRPHGISVQRPKFRDKIQHLQ